MIEQSDPEVVLPLTEAAFFILLSLAPKPKHGYAIMKEVEALSHGRVTLSTGTLYGAIKRLLEQAWIESVDETELPETDPEEPKRGRKAYQLTDWGRRILQAETNRLEGLLVVAHRQLAKQGAR